MILKSLWKKITSGPEPLLDADELAAWYQGLPPEEQAKVTAELADRVRRSGPAVDPATLTARVVGQLLFERDAADGPVPLHNLRVELWDRDIGTPDDFLGAAWTDATGHFEIPYNPGDAGIGDVPDLDLRVFEPDHVYTPRGEPKQTFRHIWTERGPDDFDGSFFDFGPVRVPYWEYDAHWPIPRLAVPEVGEPPTAYAPGRSLAMAKAVAPVELTRRKHLLLCKAGRPPTIAQIEADYPSCITKEVDAIEPGRSRGDAWFGDRLMNGMFASVLDRDPDNADGFRLYHHWNSYEQDGEHVLPNVDMRFVLKDGRLHPTRITLWLREPGATAANSPTTKHVLTAEDPRWGAAKRLARISATLDTELGGHLAQCHLNLEQYAIAAWRNLRRNPVRTLLTPHLREVVLINTSANGFLIGPDGYITRASALTDESLNQRVAQLLGTYDWRGYEPAPPVSEQHHYGHAAARFWALISDHVDRFFEENASDIAEHWVEVDRFSADLVQHAAPFFLCRHVRGEVVERGANWYVLSERGNPFIERPLVDGVPRAVSRISESDQVTDAGLENLKQVCRYVIFLATFRHTWANNRQWDDGGEVHYTSLGLRWSEAGPFAPEDDAPTLPSPEHATEMLWISYMLSQTRYGSLLDNPDRDVDPRFVDALRAEKDTFAKWDLDLGQVTSRINI